ncbi:MAG: ABC transporter permease subunit [Treponema sp.]|jgi:putative aldouronate transport system permease protein|nr:ABC transporter permease subunit [Treponema sp.]
MKKDREGLKGDIKTRFVLFGKTLYRQRGLLLLCLPALLIIIVFKYGSMYGILIAFKNYRASRGIWGSAWLDPWYKNFQTFFRNPASIPLIWNTVKIGVLTMIFSFPAPVIFAMLLNELKSPYFKRVVQSVSYIPHFISVIVVVGMLRSFGAIDGLFNVLRGFFGLPAVNMNDGIRYFYVMFIGSHVWQTFGWSAIIYIAALSNVDPVLYDVATIDGANRWQKAWNIAWPTILPTTTIMLIMNMGGVLNSDYQKILLMQNDTNRSAIDVISSFVYREGILGARFEYTTAVNLMLSVVAFLLVIITNKVVQKINSENSLW